MSFGLSAGTLALIGGGIAAGGSIIGGSMGASAARDAAGAQAASADRGIAAQQAQFQKVQQLLSPFVTAATGKAAGGFDEQRYLQQNPDVAADPYYGQHALEHWQTLGQFEGRPSPITQTAQPGALGSYLDLLGLNGTPAQQAGINGIQGGAEFGSLSKQGQDAILQAASATGGLRGGNTESALATFRTNLLSGLIDKQLGRLGGVVQLGQNSAAGVGNAAMTTGQGVSGLLQQQGAAQAGGIISGNNAIVGALGNVGGLLAGRAAATPIPAPTPMSTIGGGGGFGSGVVYGNQDLGQYF